VKEPELCVFVGPIAWFLVLYALGKFWKKAADALLGLSLMLLGIGFLFLVVSTYLQTSESLLPSKIGGRVVAASEPMGVHVFALGVSGLVGGFLVYVGSKVLRRSVKTFVARQPQSRDLGPK
jgi:hypothetical protein